MYHGVDIRLIEAFHAVIKWGTTTAAAEVLNTSQPSVSRALHRLEALSKLKLFERQRGRLSPTTEAYILFDEIEKTYLGLENISQTIRSLRLKQDGHIAIVCSPVMSYGFISDTIKLFSKHHPNINLTVESQLTPVIAELMAAQRYDIAVINQCNVPAGVTFENFTKPHEVCIFPSGHRFKEKSRLELNDFTDEHIIGYPSSSPIRKRLENLFRDAKISPNFRIETTLAESVGSMVSRGLGVAILNPFTAVNLVESGLVGARHFRRSAPYPVDIWRPVHRPASALVDLFVDCLHECRDRYTLKMEEYFSPG